MKDVLDEFQLKAKLMDQLPYEVVWVGPDAKFIYANEKFCNTIGYNSRECGTLSVLDINTTLTPEGWKAHWKEVMEKGSLNFTTVHKTKKGRFYDVEVYVQKFSYNGKNYLCAIAKEITEPNFHKKIIDNTYEIGNIGGWELTLLDGSIMATPCAMEILKVKDLEGLTPPKVIHKFKDSGRYRSLLGGVIRNGTAFDEILETNDSPPRYVRAAAKPILKGNKIYRVFGIYQDITEIKQKDSDLNFHKAVMENARDFIAVFNKEGDVIHCNKSLMKHLGYSQDDMLNQKKIFELDPGASREWWDAHFQEIIDKGSLNFERLLSRADDTQFPIDVTANHLRFNGQDYNCAVGRDITAKKMRDLELHEALQEIKALKERLEIENEYLQEEIGNKINFKSIISSSETYKSVLIQVEQVAPTDTTVLITGESGTGKELLARAIHSNSKRGNRPLIKVNCATLAKELIESELFGHRKGAFTGATAHKEGKFTLADGGTIFLDEIGELPLELQPKLLRVIQEGEFDELGGTKTIKVDVRIIAATNRDLKEMIREGSFREDLFYRLNVFPIHNIPLRARKPDIPILAQYFLEKYSVKAGKAFKRLAPQTLEKLMAYNFPGNIRELENLIERAVIIENGTTLNPGNWLPEQENLSLSNEFKSLEANQREYIIGVLEHTQWRVGGPSGAAKILNVNDKTLFAKMKRLGIEKQISAK
ncbi:sigma 54-interacting transcriptional regulator [Muricauda oceani]|uniref:Sigma 54-interacting transcriptional regulator n=1 Tax=Flagellimonas oceani TaxID=2698672 RepID=A0A6G7IZE3_9FLAO|nr:sigma 54-interacting transcriptional regulator [Allomuricauda oceani]MBW8243715.1 sigma 54-interacting transcriptional regulator [Allomuricauda oceani]QII43925.1 sigma 54-interacting transcriptional regulator [Allomuricauda oceani]